MTAMRARPSSRLLVLDPQGRLLLFRFVHKSGALNGQDYWATPGGGLEADETFEAAAIRELEEETGIVIDDPGEQVARREFVLQLIDGERVYADERYFLVRTRVQAVRRHGWSALEIDVMAEHRWWTLDELATTTATVWPQRLPDLVRVAIQRESGNPS